MVQNLFLHPERQDPSADVSVKKEASQKKKQKEKKQDWI